jgi:hypothetical protein
VPVDASPISVLALLLTVAAFGQEANPTSAGPVHRIKGRTIFSQDLPKAALTIAKGLRFIGAQRVNLYGNAEAEQYLFVKVANLRLCPKAHDGNRKYSVHLRREELARLRRHAGG